MSRCLAATQDSAASSRAAAWGTLAPIGQGLSMRGCPGLLLHPLMQHLTKHLPQQPSGTSPAAGPDPSPPQESASSAPQAGAGRTTALPDRAPAGPVTGPRLTQPVDSTQEVGPDTSTAHPGDRSSGAEPLPAQASGVPDGQSAAGAELGLGVSRVLEAAVGAAQLGGLTGLSKRTHARVRACMDIIPSKDMALWPTQLTRWT